MLRTEARAMRGTSLWPALWPLFRDLERYYVLPLRFLRAHWQDCRRQHQKCKVCGQADGLNFHVPDSVWEKVVPSRWRNRVVCLRCFDTFARRREVDYSTSLQSLYFVGEQATFELQVVRR